MTDPNPASLGSADAAENGSNVGDAYVSEPTLTNPSPLNGPWEVAVGDWVFVNGLPTRDLARRIAASWNRQQRRGQPRFRARRSVA